MNSSLRLRKISLHDGLIIWQMLQTLPENENGFINPGFGKSIDEFPKLLEKLITDTQDEFVSAGFVPQTTFWLFLDQTPIGICKIRHRLTKALKKQGGHIGYAISPHYRSKGYGTKLLALALLEAKNLGLKRILLTPYTQNFPSCKLIEKNGGVHKKTAHQTSYYWIDLEECVKNSEEK